MYLTIEKRRRCTEVLGGSYGKGIQVIRMQMQLKKQQLKNGPFCPIVGFFNTFLSCRHIAAKRKIMNEKSNLKLITLLLSVELHFGR